MDLKIVIKQLLDKGLSREQVLTNLKELGVEDAEKLFDEAVSQTKPQAPAPPSLPKPELSQEGLFKHIGETQLAPEEKEKKKPVLTQAPAKQKGELEISITDLVESQGKSLFRKEEKVEKEQAVEEEEGEELESNQEPEEESQAREVRIEKVPSSAPPRTPQSLEEKIDEALALLKALENINQKILDTERKLLLRSKS